MTPIQDRCRGALIGLAIGDAIGTTLEFRPRGTFKPLTDMVGGGQFCLKKGHWTDDTSMALCLGHSLVACNGFDAKDQIQRYCNWLDFGYMSSIGTCFDIGMTVSSALRRFQKTGDPYSGAKARWASGNGSIMRLAPVAIAYALEPGLAVQYARYSSRTTHGSPLCVDSCGLMAAMLVALFRAEDKSVILEVPYQPTTPEVDALKQATWLNKTYEQIKGSGFVIESLESALWCFWHTESYSECVLAAANLGDDADTTAAIAGQFAGAFYGNQAIPISWRDALHMGEDIYQLAENLFKLTYDKVKILPR